MRCASWLNLFWLASAACAYAQTQPYSLPDQVEGSDRGTLACRTEAAMVKVTRTMTPPSYLIDGNIMDEMIKTGDCLIIPDKWCILLQEDPPLNQQDDHASKWTIKTPDGIVQMWGTPMGGD